MTREEARIELQAMKDTFEEYEPGGSRCQMALKVALTAFRPVSRERVVRVFPGCDFCNMADFGEFGFEITRHYAKICCALGSWRFPQKNEQFLFCPKCGKPLRDEAVEMVIERVEALYGKAD